MLLERICDEDLAQASYFIGCQKMGQALVIDARRDIQVYLDLAKKNDMEITHVTETHIHADYLSGTRELAAATGAEIFLSAEGGEDWQYQFDGTRLHDGDEIEIGNLTLKAVHTPGHTPEHLSFLLTDGAFADEPGYMFTGDFVFAGDLGRPDLLDEAAGGVDTRFGGARQVFASLRDSFVTLPDHIQVYPAHGSGSACGKALGSVPSSTVGYEKKFAWWARYVAEGDEQGFVDELLDGQPDAHAYFGRMKRQNRQGPDILGERGELSEMTGAEVREKVAAGTHVFVDTRGKEAVHEATVEGALAIPATKPATYAGWAFDPESDDAALILLANDQEEAHRLWDHTVRVGVDNVAGFVTSLDGLELTVRAEVSVADLEGFGHDLLLDVRNKNEYAAGHIPGAEQLSAARVLWHQDELPREGTIVTYCQTGMRNTVAAQALRRVGFDIVELAGSYQAWESANQA
ncbi:MBL fold metallo-hydrolase [Bowdeniella nasicola]|uniref:MBL fold metallo-hydrolase n=1 Tax=Bowdeniella nasicola TaxID=208480 RepID=A0A1Q5Q3R4_9ACTO|nr:rhodanese-like domain-containing protein [Bowdeniella nasicola]OKL54425.1 MBL fold metallo-hydrolase [Bowdeniella nasicola]